MEEGGYAIGDQFEVSASDGSIWLISIAESIEDGGL